MYYFWLFELEWRNYGFRDLENNDMETIMCMFSDI